MIWNELIDVDNLAIAVQNENVELLSSPVKKIKKEK